MAYLGNDPSVDPTDESPRENLIINGFFDIWQRGDSQTVAGYGSVDRWRPAFSNAVASFEKGHFTDDGTITGKYDNQGVTGNPKYFFRTIISSIQDLGNYYVVPLTRLPIAVETSGKEVIVKFWARSDAPNNLGFEIYQETWFTAGLQYPFTSVTYLSIDTVWKQFKMKISLPTVIDGIDSTERRDIRVSFVFSSNNVNIVGQLGTFDIAGVEMYAGSDDAPVRRKTEAEELRDCLRYYETGSISDALWAGTSAAKGRMAPFTFKVEKMKIPAITLNNLIIGDGATGASVYSVDKQVFRLFLPGAGIVDTKPALVSLDWIAEAEI